MKKVIIVQARMNSTRLPGKVLMGIVGKPMLVRQIERLKHCTMADEIVIATTTNHADDPLVDIARQEGVGWFRGDEHDVLSRYVGAARYSQADVIVRVTADCPLIDPQINDRIIGELLACASECDYASNVLQRTYPRGLDVEAFFLDTLLRMDRLARSQVAREHVTLFLRSERPELFLRHSVVDKQNNADLRWTVDSEADLQTVRLIYQGLDLGTKIVPYPEVLSYVRARPELTQINRDVETWDPLQ